MLTYLLISILLRWRSRLAVSAVIGRLRGGGRLVATILLWWSASVSSAQGRRVFGSTLTELRSSEVEDILAAAAPRRSAVVGLHNSAVRHGTAVLGSKTW